MGLLLVASEMMLTIIQCKPRKIGYGASVDEIT
jgi:hypothetical protein